MKRLLIGCALLVLTLCLYFGAKAYVRLTAEIREKDSLKSFGYFVMDRMPEDGAFATAFSNQEVIREASTRNLVLRASSPDGEVMKHDVKGSSFVAWSARPLNSCYRAFLSNGYAVYWLRDDEVSWYYQTFREKLTPAQELEEQAYRVVLREPAEKVDDRPQSRREVAESFFARELRRPGNIYDQGADSELVQKHWIPAMKAALPKMAALEAGTLSTAPLLACARPYEPDDVLIYVRWLQGDEQPRWITLRDSKGILARAELSRRGTTPPALTFSQEAAIVLDYRPPAENSFDADAVAIDRVPEMDRMEVSIHREGETGEFMPVYALPPLRSPSDASAVKTAESLRAAADRGDPVAMNDLGVAYLYGHGIARDPAEAVRWYRKAAELGHRAGMYNLGWAYENGEGVEKNASEAVRWYRAAAELGELMAMNNLGAAYANGEGVGQDYKEAMKWFRKAGDLGEPLAMYNVGWVYEKGLGLQPDMEEAVRWYKKAAELNEARAQQRLLDLGM